MEHTSEQLKQAKLALDKLPNAMTLRQQFIESDDYKFLLYNYKDASYYSFKKSAQALIDKLIGFETAHLCESAYWNDYGFDDNVGVLYRDLSIALTKEIESAFNKDVAEYRLNDSFGKMFDVVGTQGARKVKNCEVKNAYVLKFDGYFMLTILKGGGDKAGDYDYVTTADSLKELALGLPYLINLNEERCRRELKDMKERGQLSSGKVVYNKWFLTDEVYESIMNEMADVQEQTYAVVRRGYSDWDSYQVVPDHEVPGLSQVWKVISDGFSYDIAKEMQSRVSRVITTRRNIDSSATTLENAQRHVEAARIKVEENSSEFVRQCRNLDDFLHNNNIPEDVIVKLNESLTKKESVE